MMKKQVVNISKLQSAKVMAALYLVSSLPFVFFAQLPMRAWVPDHLWLVALAGVAIYTLCGFLFTLVGAWIYNGVATLVGGFEFTIVEVEQD